MKKFLISSILGITLVSMMGMSAFAISLFQSSSNTKNLPGSDLWTRGIYDGHNGYYMAYSYYNNNVYTHAAKAVLSGSAVTSPLGAPGVTVDASSDSYPSYSTAQVYAAVQTGATTWKYVRDDGNGDYVVSGW
jgi:hypothetical protein